MMIDVDLSALRNEADVEQIFVRPLLKAIGYKDTEIISKTSLDLLDVKGMRGQKQAKYKPDFALKVGKELRYLVEAKAPSENLDDHEWQPRGYAIILNGSGAGKLVYRYLLTNGLETRVYDPYLNKPIKSVKLKSFTNGRGVSTIEKLIGPTVTVNEISAGTTLKLKKLSLSEVNQAFAWCHQLIYRKDHISQSDAFTEFVKLIALKLMSDREIKQRYPEIMSEPEIDVPAHSVRFSLNWLAQHQISAANPMSDIQFQRFMQDQEGEIARGIRKRMFAQKEGINLNPETIEGVVRKLEEIFLFGIDADLNGRLFETFLNATMRGKDLGQFFTPRSLVKLGVQLANPKVRVPLGDGKFHTDTLVDACCGSGGFLIDALAEMWSRAEKLPLGAEETDALKEEIANSRIVGMDVANAPKLARIARLNMYLHGDGGARIYHVNALDKRLENQPADSPELQTEKQELRALLARSSFDVALTNPPFAKALDRTTPEEARLLSDYEISRAKELKGGSVRSNLLFIERYYDILSDGGRLVTVLDDGTLSGDDYVWFRKKLRKWFRIRAVVSLPGDAFQRSNARVKTSYLVAEKRALHDVGEQGPIFMYPCQYVGLDDPKRQRVRAGDVELRRLAQEEVETVTREYASYLAGKSDQYRVHGGAGGERLDVKYRMFSPNRRVEAWRTAGWEVGPISQFLQPRKYNETSVVSGDSDDSVRVLVVRYNGDASEAEEVVPSEGSYGKLYPVSEGDIVISNIAASYGSVAVVPEQLDGAVVSSEYTVLEAKGGYDAKVLQLILRSPEVRSDILLSSSGANRTRTRWALMKDVEIPYPSGETLTRIQSELADAEAAAIEALRASREAEELTLSELSLRSETAATILSAFRPPK